MLVVDLKIQFMYRRKDSEMCQDGVFFYLAPCTLKMKYQILNCRKRIFRPTAFFSSVLWNHPAFINRFLISPSQKVCTFLEISCYPSLDSHCLRQLKWVETVWTAGEWRLGPHWPVYILYLNVFWFRFYWIFSVWLLLVDRTDDWFFIHEKLCVCVWMFVVLCYFQETNVGLYFFSHWIVKRECFPYDHDHPLKLSVFSWSFISFVKFTCSNYDK